MLYRLDRSLNLGLDKIGSVNYLDVREEKWYYEPVKWGHSNNLIKGNGKKEFKPEDKLSREEASVILARFLEELNMEVSEEDLLNKFEDSESISNWAEKGIKIVVNKGLLEGKSLNKFAPKESLKRCEMAVILDRFIELNNN